MRGWCRILRRDATIDWIPNVTEYPGGALTLMMSSLRFVFSWTTSQARPLRRCGTRWQQIVDCSGLRAYCQYAEVGAEAIPLSQHCVTKGKTKAGDGLFLGSSTSSMARLKTIVLTVPWTRRQCARYSGLAQDIVSNGQAEDRDSGAAVSFSLSS